MPSSLEAAFVFALLVVPGYQIVRGYAVARGADTPPKDLYVLAQTVVASLVWLALTWVVVGDLVRWVAEDELGEHVVVAYLAGALVIGAPYAVGRGGGKLVRSARAQRRLAAVLDAVGLGGRETAWDLAWAAMKSAGGGTVTLDLDDGRRASGQYGENSFVTEAPAAPAVFLEKAYEFGDDELVDTYPGGVYVDGRRIVAVKFHTELGDG